MGRTGGGEAGGLAISTDSYKPNKTQKVPCHSVLCYNVEVLDFFIVK